MVETRAIAALLLSGALLSACTDAGEAPTGALEPQVARVEVTPGSHVFTFLGESQQLTAVPRDADGDPISDRAVLWNSSDPTIVRIDASGLATAVGSGMTTITATVSGVSGAAALSVDESLPDDLSRDEAEQLADELVQAALGILDLGFLNASAGADAGPEAGSPVEIHISFDVSRSCPIAGTIELTGSVDGIVVPEEQSASFALDALKSVSGCTFMADGTTFVVNSEGDGISISGEVIREGGDRSATLRLVGVLLFEADDGREGTCEIDLTITWSSGEGKTVTGRICDHEFDDAA